MANMHTYENQTNIEVESATDDQINNRKENTGSIPRNDLQRKVVERKDSTGLYDLPEEENTETLAMESSSSGRNNDGTKAEKKNKTWSICKYLTTSLIGCAIVVAVFALGYYVGANGKGKS